MEKLTPERRKHGCDGCHKDTATEMFLGYCKNVLFICGNCRRKMMIVIAIGLCCLRMANDKIEVRKKPLGVLQAVR